MVARIRHRGQRIDHMSDAQAKAAGHLPLRNVRAVGALLIGVSAAAQDMVRGWPGASRAARQIIECRARRALEQFRGQIPG